MMKEAELYDKLKGGRVKCNACARYCNIPDGKIGFCGIRRNIGGKLYLLVYGKVITAHIDPIEKKPLSHFMPGSSVFSIATTGCNWMCKFCQNYDISQRKKVEGIDLEPKEVVDLALSYDSDGIAYTYNEPLIFLEFAKDVGVLARKKGLYNVFVSNGYATPEAVDMLKLFLDGITVDIKGNGKRDFLRKYVGILDPEPIFQTLIELRDKTNVHVEITDLIIPEVGDDLESARRLSRWIYDNLGPDVPLHFLRFYPNYLMSNLPPTPIETLVKHYEVAKNEGLNYVYTGNTPGHPLEDTYCPSCGKVVVKRYGYEILEWHLDEQNRCEYCGEPIAILGRIKKDRGIRFRPVLY